MDEAEIEAFTALVRAFLLYKPTNPLNIMVGWCVNDYQIDIATPEGRAEYKRILDMARRAGRGARPVRAVRIRSLARAVDEPRRLEMGVRPVARARAEDPAQRVGRRQTGAIPASVREMLDYAQSKNLGLVAYVYPVMAFEQNRDWLVAAPAASARTSASTTSRTG